MTNAVLYLFPVPLSDNTIAQVLPQYNIAVIKEIKYFIVENVRSARRFLKQCDRAIDIDSLTFYTLNEHTDASELPAMLRPMEEGHSMGIISEAGCPAIADPGADIVAIAQQRGYAVAPLIGPSSILLSLMASGFNGQSFAFNGYLPIEAQARTSRLKELERRIMREHQTQIFIETPYRNMQMLEELCRTLQGQTRLCVAADITAENEYIRTMTIGDWKHLISQGKQPDLHKRPCIFLIYK